MLKRLIQYALSQLEILDTETIDLDHLDIAWGKNSVFEFKNVGLRLKKLEKFLQLPECFKFSKAKIELLRLTIPVDIYSSSVMVEIEGVEIQTQLKPHPNEDNCNNVYISKITKPKPLKKQLREDINKLSKSRGLGDENYSEKSYIFNATNLAQSFLQIESEERKLELEAAVLSDIRSCGTLPPLSDDEIAPVWAGAPMALPKFMARFLQGMIDRLQIRIRDIDVSLNLDIQHDGSKPQTPFETPDPVTIRLRIMKIDVEGMTHNLGKEDKSSGANGSKNKPGNRLICLSQIQGFVKSEDNTFSALTSPSSFQSYSNLDPSCNIFKSSDEAASFSQENSNVLPRMSSLQNLAETMRDHQPSCVPDPFLDNTRDKPLRNYDEFDQGENRHNNDSGLKKSTLGHFDQVLNTQTLNTDTDQGVRLHPLPYDLPTERDGATLVNVSIPFYTPSYQEPFKTSQCITQQSTPNLNPNPLLKLSRQQISHAHSVLPGYLLGCQASKLNPDADSLDSLNDSNITSLCNKRPDASYNEDDLTKSQLFSHEEAESLYLSAISYISPGEQTGENLPEPSPRISGASSTPDITRFSQMKVDEGITPNNSLHSFESSLPTQGQSVDEAYGIARAFSPSTQTSQINQNRKYSGQFENSENGLHTSAIDAGESTELSRQIIDIKYVRIYVPSVQPTNSDGVKPSPDSPSANSSLDISAGFTPSSMPGAFGLNSMNLEAQPETKEESSKPVPKEAQTDTRIQRDGIEVEIGRTSIQFDFSVGRLILKAYEHVISMVKYDTTKKSSKQGKSSTDVLFRLKSDEIFVNFLDNLGCISPIGGYRESDQRMADTLLQVRLNGLNVEYHSCELETRLSITLRKFLFGYKEESILSFTTDSQFRPSTRDLETSSSVQISAQITQTPNSFRCEIKTLPIQLTINLQKLDEVFSWLGGLSTVLNLGSSIASNTTIAADKANARCVRFEGSNSPETTSDLAEKKVDIRIAGLNLELEGSQCSLSLMTSTIKVVSRDEGIGLSIRKIKLSGPHLHQSNDEPAITVDITSTRIEFLSSPKNSDLDRLLSLITPSKTKYGHDDDIILDTLLLQRRKGALLRISIEELKTDIGKLNELNYLPEVWEEILRLASVAKYLPDDDRPGLLSLGFIQKINFHVDSNHVLGNIDLSISDLEVAQITLPALLAFSIGNLSVRRNTVEILIEKSRNQITPELGVRMPIIMARIIGNEMEPVIKIKMRNLNVEYRLSILTALVEFIQTFVSHESLASASVSLAALTDFNREIGSISSLQRTRLLSTGESAKPLAIDIDFRNCVLSLNPLEPPSKMLLIMTEAHLNVILPRYDSADILVELGKVSILIIDDVVNLTQREESPIRNQNLYDKINHVSHFCAMGYVSVGYISSTKAKLRIRNCEEQSVDVEVCDALIVLESCADSTKTLIDIVKGLIPLTVVSNEESKYRTKVVPVDDLLSSLSADAFGTAEGDYNFDDDFCFDENSELGLPAVEFEEGEDFSFGSQYLHHKIGETFSFKELPESLSHLTTRDSQDSELLNSFIERCDTDDDDEAELEFQENYFETGAAFKGNNHIWNSAKNAYERSATEKVRISPIKVTISDIHLIWNLFDGYDWPHTRDVITKAVRDVESKVIEKLARQNGHINPEADMNDDEESVIKDFLFNSIYIGVSANRDPRELARAINQELNDSSLDTESIVTTAYSGPANRLSNVRNTKMSRLQLNRSKHHKISFELQGVRANFIAFSPSDDETQSSLEIFVHDFEIFDHLPTSTWKKFATYMQDAGERESNSNMIHLEILNVKPIAELTASEIVMRATVLPLRLHVDQDALDFITRFFEFKDDTAPVQTSGGEVTFFQRVEINTIRIKLDFKPKRVNYAGLRSGHTTEFMNFLILDEADIELRHTIIYGILGPEKLGKCLNDIWMPDVKRNQLPGILAGLAPVRSLVNVSGGFRHLIIVPMREYKKDGRVMRSMSKGAVAFAKTTGTELIKLGAKVAIGVQTVLQTAEEIIGSTDEHVMHREYMDHSEEPHSQISLYANQPVGVLQGLRGGYSSLQRDLITARDAVIAIPGEMMESGTAVGALKAVGKYSPTIILRPAIGVAKAGGQILMGATNSLDPVNLRRAEAKYKTH